MKKIFGLPANANGNSFSISDFAASNLVICNKNTHAVLCLCENILMLRWLQLAAIS